MTELEINPVLLQLKKEVTFIDRRGLGDCRAHRFVMETGRTFRATPRPKGFRHQRAVGQCFKNAASATLAGRGIYVEGFAMSASGVPVLHAWLSVDGESVIDQTWRDPANCWYFGIPFTAAAVAKMCLRGTYGMLSPFDTTFLAEALA